MKFERIWAMPNKWTFTIKPIGQLISQEMGGGVWIDPFAGMNSPAQVRNDLNPEANAQHHTDALQFLKSQTSGYYDGCFYDPPYSMRQAKECYDNHGKEKLGNNTSSMKYWSSIKNEIARILKPGAKAICFGWTSMGLGKGRGFTLTRILLVPHGGSKNDTIVTVEIKHQKTIGDILTSEADQ